MDRAEATGLGASVVAHGLLLAALTFGIFAAARIPPPSDAIEVSFVDEVALRSASPEPAAEPPARPPAAPPPRGAPLVTRRTGRRGPGRLP